MLIGTGSRSVWDLSFQKYLKQDLTGRLRLLVSGSSLDTLEGDQACISAVLGPRDSGEQSLHVEQLFALEANVKLAWCCSFLAKEAEQGLQVSILHHIAVITGFTRCSHQQILLLCCVLDLDC